MSFKILSKSIEVRSPAAGNRFMVTKVYRPVLPLSVSVEVPIGEEVPSFSLYYNQLGSGKNLEVTQEKIPADSWIWFKLESGSPQWAEFVIKMLETS